MKLLKRLLLINWYSYAKEVINFDQINFLTGKTASGKSTIIDALQLVILGDTNSHYFNNAANEKSVRTLKGYLYGQLGDDGEGGFNYLRNDPFTSYVALEFEDTESKELFSAIFIADCEEKQNYKNRWLVLNKNGFPSDEFINPDNNIPYDFVSLRNKLNIDIGKNRYEVCETNRAYQQVIMGKFGSMKDKYRSLFKKAVPFTPINDIEGFITESICDSPAEIKVEQMQTDIREYKKLQADIKITEQRLKDLAKIKELSNSLENEHEKLNQQEYLYYRGTVQEALDKIDELKVQIKKKEAEIENGKKTIETFKQNRDSYNRQFEKLNEEFRTSDQASKEKNLKDDIGRHQQQIDAYTKQYQNSLQQLKHYALTWLTSISETIIPANDYEFLNVLNNQNETSLLKYPLTPLVKDFEDLHRIAEQQSLTYAQHLQSYKEEKTNLEETINKLEQGIKPFPDYVIKLQQLLTDELFKLYPTNFQIKILADCMEIKDPKWQNAIEGYLDKQKFYLLVPQDYYADALRIYNQVKKEMKIYDAGLVDIKKLGKEYHNTPLDNSLAEEIETNDQEVRLYIDYLLGQVIKCEDVKLLNTYKTAITPEGMLYKNYVGRKINPIRYLNPFIGRHSTEIQLANNRKDLANLSKTLEETDKLYNQYRVLASYEIPNQNEINNHQERIQQYITVPSLEEELAALNTEYNALDLMYLNTLNEKIATCRNQIDKINNSINSQIEINTKLNGELELLVKRDLLEQQNIIDRNNQLIGSKFEASWITKVAEPHFLKERASEKRSTLSLSESFSRSSNLTKNKIIDLRNQRITLRSDYNSNYKMPFDINKEDNRDYDKEFENFNNIQLPKYQSQIQDAQKKAYFQFRDDFIAKLKSNIERVKEQITELNKALKTSIFGNDSYHYEVKPKETYKAYYEMIMDPLMMGSGDNLSYDAFNDKYQKEIEDLFRYLIMDDESLSSERRLEYENNIKKYTDYKTYLSFDMILTNEKGVSQRLSKTLKTKSGGETQTPFYVSLLAAFSQECRIQQTANNTIRLIVLDEAFSKMDGERIQECIKLLKRIKLQAIFSAPPDKIPDIAPIVDQTIVVYKDQHHSFTRPFKPEQINEIFEEQ